MTDRSDNGTPSGTRPLLWTVLIALGFGLTALIAGPFAGLEITTALVNEEGRVTSLTLFVGVFLTACLFGWLLMARLQRYSLARGALTGVFVGLFSYPAVLFLTELVQRSLAANADPGQYESRGGSVLMTTGLMLMTTGFASVLIMGLAGVVFTWLLRRFHPGAAAGAMRNARPYSTLGRLLLRVSIGLAAVVIVALLGAFAWLSLLPLGTAGLAYIPSASKPAESYEEAMAAFLAIRTREYAGVPLHERCPSTLLTHGRKVARVVVYYHGLTSCPAQGDALAERLFAMGYNVYLPRMFGHGEADPLTLSLADMRAEDLVHLANESADLAQGLGDEVVVIGLSAGGTVASWTAQYRGDVDLAIAVAPFFGPYIVPSWANHAATNLLLTLPNAMVWWNPLETVRPPELDYAYARYATHGLAQTMRLGAMVAAAARATPPAAPRVAMLLNDADVAVNKALAEQVIASWRSHGRAVDVEVLPFWLRLPHDLINAREPAGNTDLVFAKLIEMMNRTSAP